MSLCDTCPQPGHCCRAIRLSNSKGVIGDDCETFEEAEQQLALISANHAKHGPHSDVANYEKPLPFRPLFRASTGWVWWCPNLNRTTGRCDDYDNRPAICVDYQPLSDPLCILYEKQAV